MAHGTLVPQFWDDENLGDLPAATRLLAAFLITSRQAVSLPGLINLGVAGLSEAAHLSHQETTAALAQLAAAGFCQFDERRRIIRVFRAPKYNRAANPNMLRAWWRRWGDLPACPLRDQHVASLRDGVNLSNDAMLACWEETFGTVEATVTPTVKPTVSETVSVTNGVGDGEGVVDLQGGAGGDATRSQLALVPTEPTVDVKSLHERLYALYPASKREKKAQAQGYLLESVRTPDDAERLERVVRAAIAGVSDERYLPAWFRLCRDWEQKPDVAPARASPDPRRGSVKPLAAHEYPVGDQEI